MIEKFHYLTQDIEHFSHQELIELACINGIQSIQLRVKNKTITEYLSIARDARTITSKYNVTLIINDNVDIALDVDADGVHLGLNDMPIVQARKILGNDKIIGATANNIENIRNAYIDGANYIGLGPYQFTSTKQNLSSIIGIDGYKNILDKMKIEKMDIPIIAIGGIKVDDVEKILASGVYGIAISSALHYNQFFESNLEKFKAIKQLDI